MKDLDMRPRTYFIDIDGTLLVHKGKNQVENCLGEGRCTVGALHFINDLHAYGHHVVLTTGRCENLRQATIDQLRRCGIAYHQLVMGLPPGVRILINDSKSDLPVTAYGITVKRDEGLLDLGGWEEHTVSGETSDSVLRADVT